MSAAEEMERIERRMRQGGVRVVGKATSWHQRAIDRLLRVATLGRMDRYLSGYVTTIGRMIYVPDDWASWDLQERVDVLRHELVHVEQFARYGLLPMAIAYLLVPFPVGIAWCRMRLEREAYEETLRAAHERGGRAGAEGKRAELRRRFIGPDYLWMWPFPAAIDRWIDRVLDGLDEASRAGKPRL